MAKSRAEKELIAYNVKKVVIALYDESSGTYGTVQDVNYAVEFAKEKSINTAAVYGDGEIQTTLVADSGMTGTLTLTAADQELEVLIGSKEIIDGAYIEREMKSIPRCAIGFETEYLIKGAAAKVKKVWHYGVEILPGATTLSQTTDTPQTNNFAYPLTIYGNNIKNAAGTADDVDSDGQTRKGFSKSVTPDHDDYATFLATVSALKMVTVET